jgi:hypothetical protein
MHVSVPRLLVWCLSLLAIRPLVAEEYLDETRLVTLFAFDQVSIPFTQNLRLEMQTPVKHPANPVVPRGEPGAVDAMAVQFYGSVIREGKLFRMWYVAQDDDLANPIASARWRPAYAESLDGIHWTKPELGLVEFQGDKRNNLILMEPSPLGCVNLKVLPDPQDPEPDRRYKISTHIYFRHHTRLGSLAPFVSSDGLRWKMLGEAKPVKNELKMSDLFLPPFHFEPSGGLYRWDGMYYLCGQNAMSAIRPYQGRVIRMYRSSDFARWSSTNHIGFLRAAQHDYLGPGRSLEGEQTHEGISVWNRNNVLLGIYGRWHGARAWEDITVDLGFLVSNDGLNFREPVHEWTWLPRGQDGTWDQGGLLQGQGFENVGQQTFIYYGAWDPRQRGAPRGGVGLATLPRDRFAALTFDPTAEGPGDYQQPKIDSEMVTAPLSSASDSRYRFYLNADGLGDEARLRVEILDAHERPLPQYAAGQAAVVRRSGFQEPLPWPADNDRLVLPERYRLRLTFEGQQRHRIRLYAIYVERHPG